MNKFVWTAFSGRLLPVAAAALVLAACGGGGGGSSAAGGGGAPGVSGSGAANAGLPPVSLSGTAIDGFISGATVSCVKGGQAVATLGTTDARGAFEQLLSSAAACDAIEVAGGVDVGLTPDDNTDDLVRPALVLRAPVGGTTTGLQVTPVTTLIQALAERGLSVQAARDLVAARFGLGSADPLVDDPTRNLDLFRAGNVTAHVIEQITVALSQAAGLAEPQRQRAIAQAVARAVADDLAAGTTLAALTVDAGALDLSSPMVRIVREATRRAKDLADEAVRAGLRDIDADTLSAVVAPLAAQAGSRIAGARSFGDVVGEAVRIGRDDRTRAAVQALRDALGDAASADQLRGVLAEIGRLARAGIGERVGLGLSMGDRRHDASVSTGFADYVRLKDDQIVLQTERGAQAATLAQFESSAGYPIVPGAVRSVSFAIEQPAGATQLSATPRAVPVGVEIRSDTHTLQAVLDAAALSVGTDGALRVQVLPGATLTVHAEDRTARIRATEQVSAERARAFVSGADGRFTFNLGQLRQGSAAAAVLERGTFRVSAVVGGLRLGRGTPGEAGQIVPAPVLNVKVEGSGASVHGSGLSGTVRVN